MLQNFTHFSCGQSGQWQVQQSKAVNGLGLPQAPMLEVVDGTTPVRPGAVWNLIGFTSNVRYATQNERQQLMAVQAGLGRPQATCAALIPIRKSDRWWALAQDERRAIFEEQSHHTAIGLKYLPAIARKLFHCRDIGQPFDFLTWFEYAPEHANAFEELVGALRQTQEWQYVEREVDIRLQLASKGR